MKHPSDPGWTTAKGPIAVSLIALTLASVWLRLFNIGGFGFFGDEFSTALACTDSKIAEPWWPLLFLIVRETCNIIGFSELSLRIFPALCGIAVVPLFYFAGRRVFGSYGMIFAALFITLNHWHLFHSQSGRFYTPVFLFGGLSFLLLASALKYSNVRHALLAGILAVVAAGFHPTGLWVALCYGPFSILCLLIPRLRLHFDWRVFGVFFAPVVVALLFWVSAIIDTADFIGSSGSKSGWGYSPTHLALGWVRGIGIPILALGGTWLLHLRYHDSQIWLYVVVAGILPVVTLASLSPFVAARQDYIFALASVWFVLAGAAAGHLWCSQQVTLAAKLGFILAVSAALLPSTISHHTGNLTLDVRDAAALVKERSQPDDHIVRNFVPMLDYYLGRPVERVAGNDTVVRAKLAEIEADRDRDTWFVLRVSRSGIDGSRALGDWATRNADHVHTFEAKTFRLRSSEAVGVALQRTFDSTVSPCRLHCLSVLAVAEGDSLRPETSLVRVSG